MKKLLLFAVIGGAAFVFGACFNSPSAKERDMMERDAFNKGVHWAISRYSTNKLLLAPGEFRGNYSQCIFVKIVNPEPFVNFGGAFNMIDNCYFAASTEAPNYWANREFKIYPQ